MIPHEEPNRIRTNVDQPEVPGRGCPADRPPTAKRAVTASPAGGADTPGGARITTYPYSLFAMWRAYLRVRVLRDRLLRPVSRLLARIGATPNILSVTGVLVMGCFAGFAPAHPLRAVGILVLVLMFDISDGALARYLNRDSDRGKFVDMVCDTAVFTLLLVGIVRSDQLGPVAGLSLAYLMLLSKVLRCVRNAMFMESDWYFKAVAGFLPNAIVGLFFVLYMVAVTTRYNLTGWAAIVSIIILTVDAVRFLRRIVSDRPEPRDAGGDAG